MSKYELFEPQNESFEEFISKTLNCQNFSDFGNKKHYQSLSLKGLVNEEFDNSY